MKFTKKDLAFILYNNRSKYLVKNFIDKDINPFRLQSIEINFKNSKDKFMNKNKMVEIPLSDLLIESDDVLFSKQDLNSLYTKFNLNVGKFNSKESKFLEKRGINSDIIKKWSLTGLSNFEQVELQIIGASVHPIMSNVLSDGIEGGGICFPLYEGNKLENCAIRKISLENTDKKSLKYSLACPDVPVWKSNNIRPGDEIWLTEGLFDMFALDNIGYKSVSCSSAIWSSLQLYQIINLKPSKINIFSDNDEVGLRVSAILKDFFESYLIDCQAFKSRFAKDASEHFFELGKSISHIEEIDFNNIEIPSDNSFNFLNYLKNRNY